MTETTHRPDPLDGRYGAYTYRSARAALGDHGLRVAVDAGELVGFGRGVLLDARRVLNLRTRAAGALLLAGPTGVLVGPTAAALHGCTAVGGFPVHVAVPYARRVRSRLGLVVHQRHVPGADVGAVDGLRVLVAAAAVGEMLCTAPRRAALACADQALRPLAPDGRATFVAAVRTRLAARADRRGTRRAAGLLALATGLPASPPESALVLILADAGLPPPTCQHEIRDERGRVLRQPAFAWPDARIALEYAGRAAPNSPAPADLADDAELGRRGWTVLRADNDDLAEPTALSTRLRARLQASRLAA